MTQRRVENTRVHFWTFSPVSVKTIKQLLRLTFRRKRAAKAQKSETTISFSLLQAVEEEFVDRVGTT